MTGKVQVRGIVEEQDGVGFLAFQTVQDSQLVAREDVLVSDRVLVEQTQAGGVACRIAAELVRQRLLGGVAVRLERPGGSPDPTVRFPGRY